MTSIVVEREKLPLDMLRWLEAEGLNEGKTMAVILSFDERGGSFYSGWETLMQR